jgi:hypothetical protein
MPLLTGAAETLAVTAAIRFQNAHPNATVTVNDTIHNNSFSVTVTEKSGAYFFSYTVNETANLVNVNYFQHHTASDVVLTSTKLPKAQMGGLVYSQSNPSTGTVTSLQIVTETNANETVFQYPSPTASTASSTAKATAANPPLSTVHPQALDQVIRTHLKGAPNGIADQFDDALASLVAVEHGHRL